jgi:hypothetical protein
MLKGSEFLGVSESLTGLLFVGMVSTLVVLSFSTKPRFSHRLLTDISN